MTRWQARRRVNEHLDARDVAMLFDSTIFGIITRWLFSEEERSLRDDMSRMSAMFIRMVSPAPPQRPA